VKEIAPARPDFVKRLPPRLAQDPEARRQWGVEAAVLSALAGRGAPRFLEAGEDANGPWIRMEEIAWPTLHTHLGTQTGTAWLAQAARAAFGALATVHEADADAGPLGIVHADLSLANVAIAPDGEKATLLDFGLAVGCAWPRPPSGEFRGTILYAAPELARAEAFDVRADLHALAAALLHLASGEPPRSASTMAAAIAEAAEAPLTAWAERAAGNFSPVAAGALVACVAFEANDRPGTAREVVRALVDA
jgi:serine/threonine protein kinase